jgi:hypothetical protein
VRRDRDLRDIWGGLEDIFGTPLGFWALVIFGIAVVVRAGWLIGQHFIAQ